MPRLNFDQWFTSLTGYPAPFPWQTQLATEEACRSRLIRIPTGLGKSEGVVASWSFHRIARGDTRWPNRLIWCLPMRVLVEQTEEVAKNIIDRMPDDVDKPDVYLAMGGEDVGEWFLYPERPAIIIGTQDMLLSRSLNRGYASPRARWPMEFGLLNQDALWVMDEVQLMDVGLATSAQLQSFREEDRSKELRPTHTWWMSATLQPDWLRSVDTQSSYSSWIEHPTVVPLTDRNGKLWEVEKSLSVAAVKPVDHKSFAQLILSEHAELPQGEHGKITLAVCNTVERACQTYDAIKASGRKEELELVHGRFRPAEREDWLERFLNRESCTDGVDRIIIATQVVEAGVNISAGCLITELAPWSSLVQRFGRCARYGGQGKVVVVDRGREDSNAAPYNPLELESAWEAVEKLIPSGVGIKSLEQFEESLGEVEKKQLYPYAPEHLLLRREFDELFDTTPDLTGADLDISRFIRSGNERDLQIFWLDLKKEEVPPNNRNAQQRELCSVPFLRARDWLCGSETKTNRKPKLRNSMRAWVWDWLDGEWQLANRESLIPGRIVCVAASCGGYRPDRGFDPEFTKEVVPTFAPTKLTEDSKELRQSDNQQDGEQLSHNPWKTIGCHNLEVAKEAKSLAHSLGLSQELENILELAALFHDWGKSHPAFQGLIRSSNTVTRPDRSDIAKAPASVWNRPPYMYRYLDDSEIRPGFRHELASALGLFSLLQLYAPDHPALSSPLTLFLSQEETDGTPQPVAEPTSPSSLVQRVLDCSAEEFDLLVYLVASHHGKVRGALHASPKDQEYRSKIHNDPRGLPIRGIRESDRLPSISLIPNEPNLPEVSLSLSPASLGLSKVTGRSWRERSIDLLETYGPGSLALLEATLRAADVRASRWTTDAPAFLEEASL